MNKLSLYLSLVFATITAYGAQAPLITHPIRSLQDLAIEAVTKQYMPTDEAWQHYKDAERPDVIAASMVAQMPPTTTEHITNLETLLASYYYLIARAYYLLAPSYGFTPHYALTIYTSSKPFPDLTILETHSVLSNLKDEYRRKSHSHDTQTTP